MKWPEYSLNQLCRMRRGTPIGKEVLIHNPAGGIPYIDWNDLRDIEINSAEQYVPFEFTHEQRTVPLNAVLIALTGPARGTTGLNQFSEAITSPHVGYFLTEQEVLLPHYLWYFLRFKVESLIQGEGSGWNQSISVPALRNLQIPLPTLPEQARVVEILDKVSTLITARQRVTYKLSTYVQAQFANIFGDLSKQTNIFHNTLRDVMIGDPIPGVGMMDSTEWADNSPRYLRSSDISITGELRFDRKVSVVAPPQDTQLLQLNDIVFTTAGRLPGRAYVYNPNDGMCFISKALIKCKLNTELVHPAYIIGLTLSNYYKATTAGHLTESQVPRISHSALMNIEIPIPPIEKQLQFARKYDSYIKIKAKANAITQKIMTLWDNSAASAFDGTLTSKWRESSVIDFEHEIERQKEFVTAKLEDLHA